jgi:hypothetical protein
VFFVGFVTTLCGCISLGISYWTRPLIVRSDSASH